MLVLACFFGQKSIPISAIGCLLNPTHEVSHLLSEFWSQLLINCAINNKEFGAIYAKDYPDNERHLLD